MKTQMFSHKKGGQREFTLTKLSSGRYVLSAGAPVFGGAGRPNGPTIKSAIIGGPAEVYNMAAREGWRPIGRVS